LDGAEMYEYIFAIVLLDKAEAFAFIEPFDLASSLVRHCITLGCNPDKWRLPASADGLSENPAFTREETKRYYLKSLRYFWW
jgi:hypothetical protein